jgi:tRNA-specific 2-thiouridylase
MDITFKIRHTPEFTNGKIMKTQTGFHLVSSQRLQGIAPGQFGVIYDAESKICIGSGEIT